MTPPPPAPARWHDAATRGSAVALRAGASAARAALAFALPQRCPGCGGEGDPERLLCAECLGRIGRLTVPLCARCLAAGSEPSGCVRHPRHRVFAPWVFDERAATVVHALKYGGRPALARALGAEIAQVVPPAWRPELVLEVPLHPARERERGYNQAGLLADSIADALGVPRLAGALRRTRATAPQARLREAERRRNVAGAFEATKPAWLAGRRVLVVDDVMTTGATLEACLDALVDAGAKPAGAALAWTQ